jgi:hypothetical protein
LVKTFLLLLLDSPQILNTDDLPIRIGGFYGTGKISLAWYDKETELGERVEWPQDFGDDGSMIEALGMPMENNINNGGFDVIAHWASTLQPHFHSIRMSSYDYHVAFIKRRQVR